MSAFKDMRNLLDWSTDVGKQLFHSIKLKHAMPSYVTNELRNLETAELAKTANEKLGQGCKDYSSFAMCSPSPRFPCHTKAATWLSAAYFLEQKNDMPKDKADLVDGYLTKAATFWRIEGDIVKLVTKTTELMQKAAEYDTMIPLRNSAEVKAAASWLCDNADAVLYDEGPANLAKMAGQVLDKADSYGQRIERSVKTDLLKLAGRAGCYNGKKVAQVMSTVKTASDEDADLLSSLIDTVETTHGLELQEYAVKLAETLDILSKERRNFLRELAADEPAEIVKLANDRFVKKDVFDKFAYQDWMTVGCVGEFTLGGQPDDISTLNKVQSDRLCKIAIELDKTSVLG